MVRDAERLVAEGLSMAGLVFVPDQLAIGRAISEVELVVECYTELEMKNRIVRLPL